MALNENLYNLLTFLQSDRDDTLLPSDSRERKRVVHRAAATVLDTHLARQGWLWVYKKIRGGVHRWLLVPPVAPLAIQILYHHVIS